MTINHTGSESFPVIHGRSADGKEFSLFRCTASSSQIRSSGYTDCSYKIGLSFKGGFYDSWHVPIKSFTCGFSNLHEWASLYAIQQTLEHENNIVKKSGACFDPPETLKCKFPLGFIEFAWTCKTNVDHNKATIDLNTDLKVTVNNPVDPDDVLHICTILKNFLSLGVGVPVRLATLTLIPVSLEKETQEIDVYLRQYADRQKKLNAFEMFFHLHTIKAEFEQALTNWFARYEKIKVVHGLYFGQASRPTGFIEHDFVSMVQILETYFAHTEVTAIVPKIEYKAIKIQLMQIVSEIPDPALKKSLTSKIDYGNELTLRVKILSLIRARYKLMDIKISNPEELAKQVAMTRNYYTHYEDKNKHTACEGVELINLTRTLSWIVSVCLLLELGLSEDVNTEIVKNSLGMGKFSEARAVFE